MNALKRALKSPVKRVLKPLVPVLLVAGVFAILLMGIFMSTGFVKRVPSVTLPVTGTTIVPLRVVFLVGFLVGLLLAGCYLAYRAYGDRIHAHWGRRSTWAKAMLVGLFTALVAALVLTLAHATGRVGLLGIFLGVAVTWPLVTGTALMGYRRSTRASSHVSALTTGYVLTRGLESRTLSVIVGLLGAIAGGLALYAAGTVYAGSVSAWIPLVVACALLVALTVITFNWFERRTAQRTDLTIVSLQAPASRDVLEMTITNRSDRSVDLAESLVRDTDLDLYRPEIEATLKPGQRGTFEISESFSLEPNDDAIELPLGYDLKRGGETPAIFTRGGTVHHLQWTDEAAATIGRESSEHVARATRGSAEATADQAGTGTIDESPVAPSPQD